MSEPGVVHHLGALPPVEPGPIASMLKSEVHRVLAEIPEGKNGAFVGVATESGMNIVVAHRVNDHWTVAGWFGKSGWSQPISGGAFVKGTW